MEYTRVDTAKLKQATNQALAKIEEAMGLMENYLLLLTDKERASMPRAREGFGDSGRSLARAMAQHPQIAAVTGFDSTAVVEDIENAEVLTALVERISHFSQRLADTKLTWLTEAWVPSLAAYAVAKVAAKKDGELRAVTEPMARIFATKRATKTAEPEQK